MSRPLLAGVAGLALTVLSGAAAAAVSISVTVAPGVYGRVAVGGYAEAPVVYDPRPVVVYPGAAQPVYVDEVAEPEPTADAPLPVYLWVPEWQRTHWSVSCTDYGACGVPVYFVDDGWYRDNVMRRRWSAEQRAWTQAQWIEQDRLARERWEHQRWEQARWNQQQRWEQQQRWDAQQRWNREQADRQQAEWHWRVEQQAQDARQRADWERAHPPRDAGRPDGGWQPGRDADHGHDMRPLPVRRPEPQAAPAPVPAWQMGPGQGRAPAPQAGRPPAEQVGWQQPAPNRGQQPAPPSSGNAQPPRGEPGRGGNHGQPDDRRGPDNGDDRRHPTVVYAR